MLDSSKNKVTNEQKVIMRQNLLELIMRQTNYDKETALTKLKYWNFNVLAVIKDYLNPDFLKPKEVKKITTNQKMMREIRKFCDKGQYIYDLRKKMAAKAASEAPPNAIPKK